MNALTYSDSLSAAEYNELRAAVGWYDLSANQAEQGLRHTTFLVCVRDGDKAIAMGRALFDYGYTAYLGDIIVLPAYQHRGIGSEIVRRLMQQVMAAAAQGETIMFFLGAAKGKESFYEKLGFLRTPNENAGSGMRLTIVKQ